MTNKRIKLSDYLGRKRYKPRIEGRIVEPVPGHPDRATTLEIRVDTITGRKAARVARAMLAAFGEGMGRALTGGGVVVDGETLTINEARQQIASFDLEFISGICRLVGGVEQDSIDELLVYGLAGQTRWRVCEHDNGAGPDHWEDVAQELRREWREECARIEEQHPDSSTRPDLPPEPKPPKPPEFEWSEWHLIEDDEHAGEILDDLFPSMNYWLRFWLEQVNVSIRPIFAAVFTNAASKVVATSSSRAAVTSSKPDSPS